MCVWVSSIHGVFLRNWLYLGQTVVTSFCVQFEKVGRGLLQEGERREGEWAVLAKERGVEKRVSVLKNWGEHSSTVSNKKQTQCSRLRTLCSTNFSYAAFVFITNRAVVFTSIFQDRYSLFIPLASTHTAHSPSLRLPSRSNPRPTFLNCTQNDVTTVCPR